MPPALWAGGVLSPGMLTRGTAGGCEVQDSHATPLSLVCACCQHTNSVRGPESGSGASQNVQVRAVEFYRHFYSGGTALQAGDATAAIYLILRVLRP